MPTTVVGRMTSVLFVGIFLAQILGAWLWVGQLQTSERERMIEVSQAMGARIAQTVKFFEELPKEYRHIVLDQLRDMGGTRFFVSVNKQYIDLIPIQESQFSTLVRNNLEKSMTAQIANALPFIEIVLLKSIFIGRPFISSFLSIDAKRVVSSMVEVFSCSIPSVIIFKLPLTIVSR